MSDHIPFPEVYADLNSHIPITLDQWREYTDKLTLKEYKKKEVFMSAGDDPASYGIVTEGVFRIYFVRPDGKEFIKIFKTQFQIVGALAEITLGIQSRVFVEAVTPAKMLVGRAEYFEEMCEKYHNWMKIGRMVALRSYIDKEQREFELLQLPAMDRYRIFQTKFADIADQIPNYQVASYLGITPVALSRMLNS
jgi:CRP-like cAMP-binding protein